MAVQLLLHRLHRLLRHLLHRHRPATCADQQGADGANGLAGDLSPSIIDMDIFTQLLEMDDEDDREFSKSIVWNYFDQAETTFDEMDAALSSQNLGELSTLGHFLKGSSAAVGVIKVRDSCEHMQHYGKCHGEDGMSELTKDEALKKLTITLRDVKVQYKEAAKALKAFYDEEDEQGDTHDDAHKHNQSQHPSTNQHSRKSTQLQKKRQSPVQHKWLPRRPRRKTRLEKPPSLPRYFRSSCSEAVSLSARRPGIRSRILHALSRPLSSRRSLVQR